MLGEYLKISGVSLLAAGVLLGVLTGLHVVTAVRLAECVAAEAGILLGGMAVAADPPFSGDSRKENRFKESLNRQKKNSSGAVWTEVCRAGNFFYKKQK